EALLAGVNDNERRRVLDMQAHLLEVTTGHRSGAADTALPGEPRPEYDGNRSLDQRITAKAAELGISARWLWARLDAWRTVGLWGLVDKRKTKPHNRWRGSTRASSTRSGTRPRPNATTTPAPSTGSTGASRTAWTPP